MQTDHKPGALMCICKHWTDGRRESKVNRLSGRRGMPVPSDRTLQSRSANSAVALQPRRMLISNIDRPMRGALLDTYIISADREKLSMRARDTYACASTPAGRCRPVTSSRTYPRFTCHPYINYCNNALRQTSSALAHTHLHCMLQLQSARTTWVASKLVR